MHPFSSSLPYQFWDLRFLVISMLPCCWQMPRSPSVSSRPRCGPAILCFPTAAHLVVSCAWLAP